MTVITPPPHRQIVAVTSYVLNHRPASLRNYARAVRTPDLIVLHATDGHEGFTKDTDVAAMFADPALDPRRSSGYIVDSNSATQSVPDHHVAWHSGHTGNVRGIGVEFCGRADQTHDEWLDAMSLPMLCIGARLCADLCLQWHIEPRLLTPAMLATGARSGITTHNYVALTWRESRHHDPGAGFPLHEFVDAVRDAVAMGGGSTVRTP